MRCYLIATLLASTTVLALQLPNLQPFLAAFAPFLDEISLLAQNNITEHELLKRQSNGCPSGWNNCGGLGASGLCCAPNAQCTADAANHLACCPSSATCTGTIGGYITAGTVDSNGNQIGGGGTATAATTATTAMNTAASTTTTGYVIASTTTTSTQGANSNGFIIATGATVAQPGRAARGIETPLIARLLQRLVEYFM